MAGSSQNADQIRRRIPAIRGHIVARIPSAPGRAACGRPEPPASGSFRINAEKTAVMRAPGRQVVTGLLVGDEIRLSRRDLRRLRAFLHRCEKDGLEAVSREIGRMPCRLPEAISRTST